MKNNPMHRRLGFGLRGLREGWRRERSFRSHLLLAAIAVTLLCLVRPAASWWLALLFALAVGLALELMNGALEALTDHLHPGRHPEIGAAKDMASGAVLLVNLAAGSIAAAMLAQAV